MSTQLHGEELRRNWAAPAVAALLAFVGLVYANLGFDGASFGVLLALLATTFAVTTIKRNAYPNSTPVTLGVSHAELVIGNEPAVPVTDITEARTVAHETGLVTVTLALSRGTRRFRLRAVDAATMLRELAIAAGERRATFPLMSRFRTRFLISSIAVAPLLLTSLLSVGHPNFTFSDKVSFLVFYAPVPAAFVAWILGLSRGRLVIGADGFTVQWPLVKRFYPFSGVSNINLAGFASSGRDVIDTVVTLTSGRRLRLRAVNAPVTSSETGEESRALNENLTGAFERAQTAREQEARDVTMLGGGHEPGSAWLARIDGMIGGGAARYRVAALEPQALARIASDPSQPSDARIGAAVALLRVGGGGVEAVRHVANACVEPDVHRALAGLSEPCSDEQIVELLEATRKS